jgi:hypothetical protein
VAITNYTELQAAIGNWLNRTDLSARIPEFIALAEADIARNLNQPTLTVGQTLVAGADFFSLASLLGYPKSIKMDTDTYQHPLTFVSIPTLAELKRFGTGVPYYAAIVNETLQLDVAPDSAYDITVQYAPDLVPLSAGSPTNTTLTKHPDIYLFGALKEAALYLEHDERNPVWAQKYQKAVNDANIALERAELGAGPTTPRLPIIFG